MLGVECWVLGVDKMFLEYYQLHSHSRLGSPPLEGSGEVTSLICKQFSIYTVSTHGLLASQRRPLGLQKVPFWSLINALLESN